MNALTRNNVTVSGRPGGTPILFANGFGCDQAMWRLVAPAFERDCQVVLFDHVGSGGSDWRAYDERRYSSLRGYADDINQICEALDLHDVILVGHSVSAMIGALSVTDQPERYSRLVMVGPSPRYIDDVDYAGGFTEDDISELLGSLDANYFDWSHAMAPLIMGNPDRPELGRELVESFCRSEPEIAKKFARVTFLSDNRADLARVPVPTLVLQCSEDIIAPVHVGRYVADRLPDGTLVLLDAVGHCPQVSAPEATIAAMREFVDRSLEPAL